MYILISTYHPASNREVENRNKEICKYLRLLSENILMRPFIVLFGPLELVGMKLLNSFELLYGRRDLQPFEFSLNIEERNEQASEEYWLKKFITHD